MFTEDQAHELGGYIARKIFECGNDGPTPALKATRLQYKLGFPERDGGGFIEPALASFIGRELMNYRPTDTASEAAVSASTPMENR